MSRFSSAEISYDLFLVIDHKFLISTLFSLFQYISPLFRENYYFPLLWQIPPCFSQMHLLFTYFTCISFPPTLTIMHLCITQCTYWTLLEVGGSGWLRIGLAEIKYLCEVVLDLPIKKRHLIILKNRSNIFIMTITLSGLFKNDRP